eukprot:120686_1
MSAKRKKKKTDKQSKNSKIVDVIKDDKSSKTIKLYFDITVCCKYSDVKSGCGLKITTFDTTNNFGKQLVKKANIKPNSEWLIKKCDKKTFANNKTPSIILNYIRQQFRKNGYYRLELCLYKTKSTKEQPLQKIMFSMSDISNMIIFGYLKNNECINNEYNVIPIIKIIASFCGMKDNITQFKWFQVSDITNTKYSLMIMKCNKLNKRILLKVFEITVPKPKKSFPNIFIALSDKQNGTLQLCKFGTMNMQDFKEVFELSKQGKLQIRNRYYSKWTEKSKNYFVYVYDETITDSTDTMFGSIDQGIRKYIAIQTKKLTFSCYSQSFCENSGA